MVDLLQQLVAALGSSGVETAVAEDRLHDWHVRAGPGTRPLARVRPRTTDEVSHVLRLCNDAEVPVIPQGGLTGLAGGGTAIDGAVLLSLEQMRAVEEVDPVAATIAVQAGVPLQTVQDAADAAGMLFPLDIGARGSCLIGANIATNAGGNRVLRWGMARDMVLGLEVVLADGTVVTSLNKMLKNNAGYDLKQVFIGSEGTLGVITRAVLRLFPKPASVMTALCAMEDFDRVLATLARVRTGLGPILSAFEVMWPDFYRCALAGSPGRAPLPAGHAAYCLIEAMGIDAEGDAARFEQVIAAAAEAGDIADAVVAQSSAEAARLWAIRDMSGELTHSLAPVATFDVSIEVARVASFVAEARRRLEAIWPEALVVAFGHLADGNVHLLVSRIDERPLPASRIDETVYGCVRAFGGSISAEHGIGLLKKPFLAWSRGPEEVALMRTLKRALDPKGTLNPGKVFDP